jgi:hypothetical protein
MNTETFSSQDFYLTAFLVASDHPVVSYDRQRGLTMFQFERTSELSTLVREYYADHATVSPIRYGNSLKNLKSLIHSNTNTYENTTTHNYGATK